MVSGIKDSLKKAGVENVYYAFDAVSDHNSYINLSNVLANQGSKITLVLPGKDYSGIRESIEQSVTSVGCVHKDAASDSAEGKAGIKTGEKDFGFAFFRLFSRGLQEGWFTPHPHEVIPGGLNGVEKGLANLREGINSATKYVFHIEDSS